MSFKKFENFSYNSGQKLYSCTKNIDVEITFTKKISKELKSLVGRSSVRIRKNSMIVSDNTIAAQGLEDLYKFLG